ncbi:hypothetical protein [Microbacterium sp. 3J1]|uniref:hypothetical protein n=1 Tax=Microbacterium sp. 3J1 TaxID=861269 RepID=UPI000B137D54|nr:hypothetical protein [Microbacterium sp. 3J1]
MATYARGEYVVAKRSGSGALYQGYGRVSYDAGAELEITSIRSSGMLNVRHAGGGRVFVVGADAVRPVPRLIGQIPEGGIAPEDPRVAWVFEDAGRMADRLGLCKDYDRLCDALGIPGRVRSFTISVFSAEGIEVTAKVQARSKRLAEIQVREQLSRTAAAGPIALEAARA